MARVSSKQSRTAAQISSWDTVTMSSTSSLQSRNTSAPSWVTDAPSTNASGSGAVIVCPLSRDLASRSAPSASTPITLTRGVICLITAATPASKELPPAVMKTASRSFDPLIPSSTGPICRTISRPAVAWPAMTCGSSCGCTIVSSGEFSDSRSASILASMRPLPWMITLAPCLSIAFRRLSGVRSGITTVASTPSAAAAHAIECPWLPTE
mmetsp:Transcript_58565/g.130466  ORF Transcript_58565/g.130466 Transcript_58565/m.130466 type:complete len:211 (+) Transcript_58565:1350-1982(+)